MDNLDDEHAMAKLLHQLGAHHFFYDAYEPHLELFQEGFIAALKSSLTSTADELTPSLEKAWKRLWRIIKKNMGNGIATQRQVYLAQCMTSIEMRYIRKMWDQVKNFGLHKAGMVCTKAALKVSYLFLQFMLLKEQNEFPYFTFRLMVNWYSSTN